MSLEDKFRRSVKQWRQHCKANSFQSSSEPYLDCNAFRRIVSIGVRALPLIRNEMNEEYNSFMKYEEELKRLKIKVFGTDEVKLYGLNYYKIRKDREYQQLEKKYNENLMGNPAMHWCSAVRKIVPEFELSEGTRGKVYEMQKETIEWLDKNMHKHIVAKKKAGHF